jgi:NADH-ubiquinone oxidoreductase chain 4
MNYIVGIFAILVNKDKSIFSKESVSVQDAQPKELTKQSEESSKEGGSMSKLEQSMSEWKGSMQEVEQSMLNLEQSMPKLEKSMSELKESMQEVKQSMQEVDECLSSKQGEEEQKVNILDNRLLNNIKFIALTASIFNLVISLLIFILFDFSTNQFQFVQEYHEVGYFDFYLGIDGLSIYFILLTTLIIPVSLLSNWTSISNNVLFYVIIILLLGTLLLAVFLVLDILLFYIFFESILPPLFILIGIFGSDNRVKASFYLFLYTLLGSLFLLLSILAMSSIMSTTDFDTLFKGYFIYLTQLFLFYGIFIAFAVKTPTIFLNTWLLKAHVESPLGGSIILAAIVLKLSLYGILRLILPILPKASMVYTYIIYLIGVITIVYASLSTIRTIDVKELIAYSSVSHAAVYLLGVFSNNIQGIEGGINLGLAHGLVSPGLFICAGGILYDRSHTRLITVYKGVAQIMPLFAIMFLILSLSNCAAPLSWNFIGEFMSLYGIFEQALLLGVLASSSIILSAVFTMYAAQRIIFGGSFSKMFTVNIPDLNKRETSLLLTLIIPTVLFGIYPAPILDAIHYSVSSLIYSFDLNIISCEGPMCWGVCFLG